MRSPLHARAAAVAATLVLLFVLAINIIAGQHAVPPAPAIALADGMSSMSASSRSYYTTPWHNGTATETIFGSSSPALGDLCAAALTKAASGATADFQSTCAPRQPTKVRYTASGSGLNPDFWNGPNVYDSEVTAACEINSTYSLGFYTYTATGYAAAWGLCSQ